MPRGRPHASWLRNVESYLKDAGLALPGRWRDGGRRSTVGRWTLRRVAPAYAIIPDLTATRTASTFPGNSRSGVHTIEPLKVTSPSGPDLRFSRHHGATSRFHCRTAGRGPKGAQRPHSPVGRTRVS